MDDPVGYLQKKFNDKIKNDERTRVEMEGVRRVLVIEFPDKTYRFLMDENGLNPLDDDGSNVDIRVITTKEVLSDILEGKLDPMKAYSEGMVKVDASFMDMLKARNILK